MRLPLEGTLLEKLRKIEALHAGTKVGGEREAARRAAERIRARLSELQGRETETEYRYTLHDPWKRKLFLALCRRYGLKPYRESGQRHTSVMLRAPKSFQDKTLWPEYQALSAELDAHLDELTTRVIREAIDDDVSEASDEAPKTLSNGTTNQGASVGGVESGSPSESPTKSSGSVASMRSGEGLRRFFCGKPCTMGLVTRCK